MHFPPVKPEVLFNLGPVPITNSLITSWIAAAILVIVGVLVGKNFKRLPSGIQHIFEMVYELFNGMAEDAMGKFGRKFVPFVLTYFLLIITNNWVGLIPGVGSITACMDEATHTYVARSLCEHGSTEEAKPAEGEAHATAVKATETGTEAKKEEHHYVAAPLFRGGNADLNMTFALAIIAQVVIHASGIKTAGLRHHLHHFKNPMEIITEISKVLSFGFRLFGNVFAGEVMLAVMAGLLVVITGRTQTLFGIPGGLIQTPFFLLELFVGFIQAFVFAMLIISFLSLFVKTDADHGHAGGH
jgi:F-type H+-transporting ATPase subunit a